MRHFRILVVALLGLHSNIALSQSWQTAGNGPASGFADIKRLTNGDILGTSTRSEFVFTPSFRIDYFTDVYRSTDDGASFTRISEALFTGLFSTPKIWEFDGTVFITHETQFGASPVPAWFASSSDSGATWTLSGSGGDNLRCTRIQKDGGTIFALGQQASYTSTDGGVTWTNTGNNSNFPDYAEVGSRRFYRTTQGLKYSDDQGTTQTLVLPSYSPNGEFVEFGGSLYTHFINDKALYVSADNGLNWSTVATIPGYPDYRISSLFIYDGRLVATITHQFSGEPPLVLFTEDAQTWAVLDVPSGPAGFDETFVAGDHIVNREFGTVRYLDARNETGPPVFITEPQSSVIGVGTSQTLSVFATGQGPLTYQWYQGASGDTSLPISGATQFIYQTDPLTEPTDFWVRVTGPSSSTDSATATVTALEIWTELTDFISLQTTNFRGPLITPQGLTVIQRYGNPNQVHKSTDSGDSWTATEGPLGMSTLFTNNATAPIVYSDGQYLTAISSSGTPTPSSFATSTDGINWTETANFPVSSNPADILKDGNNIYIADQSSNSGGFFRSTDGGLTFTAPASGLAHYGSREIIKTSNGTLVMSTYNRAVSTSTDNGTTWTQRYFVGSDAFSNPSDLHLHNGVIYATLDRAFSSTVGRGLWKSTDHGTTWSQVAFPNTELESVTVVDDKLIVSTKSTPPVLHVSEDGGATFGALTNTGLEGVDPGKLTNDGEFAYLATNTRLFRLRVAAASGEQVTIVTQPQDATASVGAGATLSVVVQGDGPVTYQWYRGQIGAAIPVGSNSPTYVTDPSIDYTTTYFVSVTNGFGDPVISDGVTVTVVPPPAIVNDLKNGAYFVGTSPEFGPTFSLLTPVDTTYQWYEGPSGDTSKPIAGATTAKINASLIPAGAQVWLRATAASGTVDSAAATFIPIEQFSGVLDLISRDPNGRTWDEAANSHLSEDGQFAFFGSNDPGEGNSRHPLPYVAPEFIDETLGGQFGFGNADDISNDGRYLLFSREWVHDMNTQSSSPAFNTTGGGDFSNSQAWQISSTGRYLLFSSSDSNLIANDNNGRIDLFLHDRSNGDVVGLTRFPDGSGNQSINATAGGAEIDANEQSVFFSHFATDPLIPAENANLYVYDIGTSSLSVPSPLQGKGPYATFRDASSNGRFILFGWNPALQALRPGEPIDSGAPRHWLYVYDRQDDELSFVDTPFGSEYMTDLTVSNDGRTVSFIHAPSLKPYVSSCATAGGPWATKLLISPPMPSGNTADLQMSDDGSSFIFVTLLWSLQTPQYSTGSGGELNEANLMYLSGFASGGPSFSDWAATELASFPANLRGEDDDADGDGVPNVIAWLSGRTAASQPGPALLTQRAINGDVTVTFRQRADTARRLIPQFSSTLQAGDWQDISANEVSRVEVEPGVWEITVSAPPSSPSDPKFFRLASSS
ncbi:hypothetical protein JIN81_07380 [Haloferula rosea]|uniref:Ig-like domain-containing protein n=2 Tax=Haloferula rosea TaxID=490093 RepID=A0A934VFQ8_9BACT|nr:hypothetical protein [Haloferula rosea]